MRRNGAFGIDQAGELIHHLMAIVHQHGYFRDPLEPVAPSRGLYVNDGIQWLLVPRI